MIYISKGNIAIRNMEKDDIEIMSHEGHSFNVYMDYFNEQELGSRYVFISEYNGDYAGYTTLKNQATSGPFANTGIPEISDFNVLNRYRCKGIGSMILDEAEKKAGELNVMVCLGVGLHSGYGSAQRMYVKRGYLPDGSGVWYKDKICAPYTGCINDDDLILYLSKQLAEV